jgi:hypothetical protein
MFIVRRRDGQQCADEQLHLAIMAATKRAEPEHIHYQLGTYSAIICL